MQDLDRFGVIRLNTTVLVVVLFSLKMQCHASRENLQRSFGAEELAPTVAWTINSGRSVVIRGVIASAFGLGNADIPVRQRGFRSAGNQLTDVIAVSSKTPEIVFLSRVNEADGSAIVWRTAPSGKLHATVRFDAVGGASLISDSGQEAAFNAAKKYFMEKTQ